MFNVREDYADRSAWVPWPRARRGAAGQVGSPFTLALIAVGAGPGRTRRPALTALLLVSGVVLLTALSWSS